MKISINDYVANLLAGKRTLANLYYAVDKARSGYNDGRKFYYTLNIRGVGCKTFDNYCLVSLDTKASKCSLETIIDEIVGEPTIEQYVTLLLYGRKQIEALIYSQNKALYTRSTNRIFQYRFTNPYGKYAELDKNQILFTNANTYLRFYCESSLGKFNPKLVFIGLYQ